jgi:hypothetical protein
MLLNWLRPLAKRKKLPDACMTHRAADNNDGKPAFAQTFFDQSAWTTMLPGWFPAIPRLPIHLNAQEGCTYEGYSECESSDASSNRLTTDAAAARARACIAGFGVGVLCERPLSRPAQ